MGNSPYVRNPVSGKLVERTSAVGKLVLHFHDVQKPKVKTAVAKGGVKQSAKPVKRLAPAKPVKTVKPVKTAKTAKTAKPVKTAAHVKKEANPFD